MSSARAGVPDVSVPSGDEGPALLAGAPPQPSAAAATSARAELGKRVLSMDRNHRSAAVDPLSSGVSALGIGTCARFFQLFVEFVAEPVRILQPEQG
jgi:hypothetical protein